MTKTWMINYYHLKYQLLISITNLLFKKHELLIINNHLILIININTNSSYKTNDWLLLEKKTIKLEIPHCDDDDQSLASSSAF